MTLVPTLERGLQRPRSGAPGRQADHQGGFTLVELMVAALITLVVVGGAFALLAPAQRMFQSQPEAADLQQRVRVAADGLRRELLAAGAGTYTGPARGALTGSLAPVMPFHAFGDTPDPPRGVFYRPDAISLLYVAPTPSQTLLSAPLAAGALDPQIEHPPNCPLVTAQQVCGFDAGDRVLLADDAGSWDVFSVDRVINGAMSLLHRGAPSAMRYPTGTIVSEIRAATYFLKSDPVAGTSQLMRHDGWVTDLPVVDEVVALAFRYFGDPVPPQLSGAAPSAPPGRWTTYGPAPPPLTMSRGAWPVGESCTFVVAGGVHAPRLPTLGAGGQPLVELSEPMLTDGPWCPDALSAGRFDADLLRVRRVRVSLRVQSAVASLRGPAGLLFARGGTARAGDRMVPDMVVQFDVTPRNMGLR